jgi:hypothetical protein
MTDFCRKSLFLLVFMQKIPLPVQKGCAGRGKSLGDLRAIARKGRDALTS